METFHVQLCNLPSFSTSSLHGGNSGHLLVLIRTEAWVQSLFGVFGFHGEIFWSGATGWNLNPSQSSWKFIRERVCMTQYKGSAGKQLKSELELTVLVVLEDIRHTGKNGTHSWHNWLGTMCFPLGRAENTLSSGSPSGLPLGMSSGLAPNPLCWELNVWLGTYS